MFASPGPFREHAEVRNRTSYCRLLAGREFVRPVRRDGRDETELVAI